MKWILIICTILGGLGALWYFKDRCLPSIYHWLCKVWSKLVKRGSLITVTIRRGDVVRVKILDYKYPRDLGPLGRSWQDPHVRLLSWHNGREFIPVAVGFKAVLAKSESSVPRYIGDRSGEGMFIPDLESLPEQCWNEHFVKDVNNTVWGILKKLVVFETFIERYRNTPLEAKVLDFSGAKDGFLHLRNVEYDKILDQEYRVCILLVSLFQNGGFEWINDIQNIPVSEILGWIRQSWKELRGWIRGTGLEIDEGSLTEERCRRVLVSFLPPHILKELVKV